MAMSNNWLIKIPGTLTIGSCNSVQAGSIQHGTGKAHKTVRETCQEGHLYNQIDVD